MNNIEHYFDWAATSPEDAVILREALEIAIEHYENPSSVHSGGIEARKVLEEARERSAKAMGVKAEQVYFTSGGTESDHIPLLSLLAKPSSSQKGRIILSGIEHPALREQCDQLKKLGFDVVTVNPNKDGFVSVESIAEKITSDTLYVTVMAVNNETGCVQPIYEIADKITELSQGKRRPHFHVDCVQAAGKIPLNLSYKGIDSAALSAHKICGPRGIGILYLSNPEKFKGFLIGGGQEKNVRSGTENLFGAVAFSKVLEKYYLNTVISKCVEKSTTDNNRHFDSAQGDNQFDKLNHHKKQIELTRKFLKSLSEIKNCRIVPEFRTGTVVSTGSTTENFSPYVVQAAFLGIPGNVMVRALDAKGFAISTGSACSAKKQSRPILDAMKTSREIQDSAVRFSFGALTTEKGMEELLQAVKEVCSDFNF